jgi:hypothetical protein
MPTYSRSTAVGMRIALFTLSLLVSTMALSSCKEKEKAWTLPPIAIERDSISAKVAFSDWKITAPEKILVKVTRTQPGPYDNFSINYKGYDATGSTVLFEFHVHTPSLKLNESAFVELRALTPTFADCSKLSVAVTEF